MINNPKTMKTTNQQQSASNSWTRVFPASCPPPSPRATHNSELESRTQSLFKDVCDTIKPLSILEVGSWLGASALAWAKASQDNNPTAKIYCIDTWLGSPEHYLNTCGEDWSISRLDITEKGPQFFESFLSNIHARNQQESIFPMRADSSSALPFLVKQGAKFDVIYIDGAHDAISVSRDIANSCKLISQNGLICGDDFSWGSVRDGICLAWASKKLKGMIVLRKKSDFLIIPSYPRDSTTVKTFVDKGYSPWKPCSRLPSIAKRLAHLAVKIMTSR